ncbi:MULTISPECIES: histidinol-phosphate transaminase [unclassified Nocardiopsis]|uniref:histidinol-phosphate transaminase n=1 Tax=unclassified Nocardiopsis TaxID=2649073 RepID=UPI00066CF9E7|nr:MULTISPECIES: histidinol-phosphate transaminase [unclassified Nocardiopsis]MBQ1082325.1 histidinol-phosphate transaminase [Nocardiopsis sp. B62]
MVSESKSPYLRAVLESIPAYKPGRKVVGPDGRSIKLSSNESPFGPLPSVREAIARAAADLNRYPDPGAAALVTRLAGHLDVPEEHVALGAGSVGMLQQLLEAVGEPGAEVVYAWRSFEAYPLLAELSGVTSVRVPLRDETHDLEALLGAITDNTRMVLVCNPNNPTGTAVRERELVDFLDRVPDHVLVVLDEAYREYVRDPEVPDGVALYRDRPNVAVLRTFSKAYGLAAVRLGFLVGHPSVTDAVRKTLVPFAVNHLAQAAGIASLDAEAELLERVETTVKERERVRDALVASGWTVPPTEANFVWLRLAEDTLDFAAACAEAGVSVRPFDGEGARVSLGTPEENDAFLSVATAYAKRR